MYSRNIQMAEIVCFQSKQEMSLKKTNGVGLKKKKI